MAQWRWCNESDVKRGYERAPMKSIRREMTEVQSQLCKKQYWEWLRFCEYYKDKLPMGGTFKCNKVLCTLSTVNFFLHFKKTSYSLTLRFF